MWIACQTGRTSTATFYFNPLFAGLLFVQTCISIMSMFYIFPFYPLNFFKLIVQKS